VLAHCRSWEARDRTKSLLYKLSGGDLRSIGNADKVVREVLARPSDLEEVFEGIFQDDPVIRARCADVAEKVGRARPEYLQPFKSRILYEASKIGQQEVRWHVAQMLSYLRLSRSESKKAEALLSSWLGGEESSRIVKVMSLQALADLAKKDKTIRSMVLERLDQFKRTGTPAIKARSRKLVEQLC
jgi:hypothetical protein